MAKQKPVHRIVIGTVEAAIWENRNDKGTTWFNVTFSRSYPDQGQLKSSTSFRLEDLPLLSKLVDMAFLWMWKNGNRRPGATRSANHG